VRTRPTEYRNRTALLLLVLAAALALGADSCDHHGSSGGSTTSAGASLPSLSIATVNIANATDVGGITWQTRIDRLSAAIESAQLVPDIISMTESAGLWRCSSLPFTKAGDYDMADRLIRDMRLRLDAHYRVAYMVGASGTVNNFAGTPLCWYYSGDTVLYNPARLTNLTPADVAGKAQEMHDGPLVGFQVRHSLPICTRGTNLEPMETLIDGGLVADPRCPQSEPSGPAWAQVVRTSNGSHAVVATLARFGFLAAPGSSFDVVTTHPTAGEEEDQASTIDNFIRGATSPPYRTTAPYYPVVVVGDFNILRDPARGWPAMTKQLLNPTDLMVVSEGDGVGMTPQHQLNLGFGSLLPSKEPCALPAGEANAAFSDHCGLIVRLDGS
jgi:hypothetical protein